MKFDIIIGNPPYQENMDHRGEQPPLYHKFYEASISLVDFVCFITPARFLFDVGKTPKEWNRKMLNSPHFKVEYYFANSKSVFPSVDIKGGVAITSYDKKSFYEPIGVFIPDSNTRGIVEKVRKYYSSYQGIDQLLFSNTSYRYRSLLFEDYPDFKNRLSGGSARYLASSAFKVLHELFDREEPVDQENYLGIWGRLDNKRELFYVPKKYFHTPENVGYYKLLVPSSMGAGEVGELLSDFIIGAPNIGATETFISFGKFSNRLEAEYLEKYLKTKFARLLLSVKKVTQGNKTADVWKYIPIQDFTKSSDIDWSKTITEIDEQLFRKYGLTEDEQEHIRISVKEMSF